MQKKLAGYTVPMQRVDLQDFKHKRIALVLSGGVVKAAAWHLGVALALEELGFTFKHNNSPPSDLEISTYVGSSAGSIINLYFASGFSPLDVVQATLDRKHSKLKPIAYKDMLSLKSHRAKPPKSRGYDPMEGLPFFVKQFLRPVLEMSGIFTTKGLHDYFLNHILPSNDFNDFESDLFVVATQLDHSRKVIFSKYHYPNPGHDNTSVYYTGVPVADTVAASTAVPPFYSPYPIHNPITDQTDYYIDGEIRETLSTHVAVDNGCELIISSWTHTPYHYHEDIGSLVNYGLPAICTQAIYLMIQKKIVTHRAQRHTSKDIIQTVDDYLKENKFDNTHRRQLLSILERKLFYKPNIQLIDICPKHENYKTFLGNAFSLNPKKTSEIVSSGYKRAFEVFKKYEWQN